MDKVVDINTVSKEMDKGTHSAVGMMITLLSFTMLFATLFMAYAVYRLSNSVWPPMGFEQIPLIIPAISTLVIILSSATYYSFEKSYKLQNFKSAKRMYWLTLFFGFGFLVSQYFLWKQLNLWGLYVESGIFASILHGFTWIHAAHVALGILGLVYLIPVMMKENTFARYELRILNIGKFWHFLDIVWILMFIVLFVL